MFPAAEPLLDLRARVDSWAGQVLLADLGGPPCPRCTELAAGSAWSSTAHVHTPDEQGAYLLAGYLQRLTSQRSAQQLRRDRAGLLLAKFGLGYGPGGAVVPLDKPYVPPFDPLGPVAGYLAGWESGPVAAWARAQQTRTAANRDRRAGGVASLDARRLRKVAAESGRRADELAPAAAAWWGRAADEWSLFVHDLELADEYGIPATPITDQPGGLSWH